MLRISLFSAYALGCCAECHVVGGQLLGEALLYVAVWLAVVGDEYLVTAAVGVEAELYVLASVVGKDHDEAFPLAERWVAAQLLCFLVYLPDEEADQLTDYCFFHITLFCSFWSAGLENGSSNP